MKRDTQQEKFLFNLVESEGPRVIHLPYTPAFEKACSKILRHDPSAEEMHEIWEQILQVGGPHQAEAPSAKPGPQLAVSLTETPHSIPDAARVPLTPGSLSSVTVADSLFGDASSVAAQQPWTLPIEPLLSTELQQQRSQMLADVANSQLGTTEQRVAYLLQRFPETRENDVALCIRYWRRFQADVLEKWQPLELEALFELDKLETIGRIRRHIQHALRLYRGMEETSQNRDALQRRFHEYLTAHSGVMPEIRFYLDETGSEGDKVFTGVAGLCVMNWQQYEKYHAALAKWRRKQNWPGTIHFSETGSDNIDRAVRLLGELGQRRSGLLFLGYAIGSRGRTHQDLLSLFIQLVMDSLKCLDTNGCLDQPRSLRIVKEADSGFDNLFLAKMDKQLSDLVGLEFPGRLVVQPIEAIGKGREIFLECADLIAGGMQRRALYKGRNPKDRLAEAVFNVTGFEDAADNGAVFKFYPAHV